MKNFLLKMNDSMRRYRLKTHPGMLFAVVFLLLLNIVNAAPMADVTVEGKIVDEKGEPVTGAVVTVKGNPTLGTTTDIDGAFKITVPDDAVLIVEYAGYGTQEINVAGQTTLNISLAPDAQVLTEVAVIGYGTQKRTEVTGATQTIKEKDFIQGAFVNPIEQINGRVAGLNINLAGTDPTQSLSDRSSPRIQLRGVSSVNAGTAPLVIIDGVPGGDLNSLSPNDIETIDVLKDGSAAAIYGTRGTNGVIIITTKRGKQGAPTFDYNGYVSFETVAKQTNALSAQEYRDYYNANLNSPNSYIKNKAGEMKKADKGGDTDWFKELTRVGMNQYHNLALSGGTANTNYRASVNYNKFDAVAIGNSREQFGGRININHRGFNDKLNVNLNINNLYRKSSFQENANFEQALMANPTQSMYNSDGGYYFPTTTGQYNPIARIRQEERKGDWKYLTSNLSLTYDLFRNIKLGLTGSIQRTEEMYRSWAPSYSERAMPGAAGGEGLGNIADRRTQVWLNRIIEPTVTFTDVFAGKHSVNAVAGYSYQDLGYDDTELGNTNFPNDATKDYDMSTGQGIKSSNSGQKEIRYRTNRNESTLVAFLARVNYAFDEKYLLSVGIRHEGSSKFGINKKWGNFPQASVGWRLNQENFLKPYTFITNLKFRAGFGVTGNQDFDPYRSITAYNADGNFYPRYYSGSWVTTYGPAANVNPYLRWEKKHEFNVGVDFGFLENRVNGSVDWYNRETTDLLFESTAPQPPNIFPTLFTNIGKMRNRGMEVLLTVIPIQKEKLTWTSTFTWSYNKNTLSKLNGTELLDVNRATGSGGLGNMYRLQQGESIGNFLGYKFAGFDNSGTNQRMLVYNNNGVAVPYGSANTSPTIIGNGLPKMFASWINTVNYRNFDLSFMFRGAFLFDILNLKDVTYGTKRQLTTTNVLKSAITTHDEVNTNTIFLSDYFVEKGDFVKLDNVTLGYTLKFNQSKYFRNARIYVSGRNLLVITKYSGLDPEVPNAGVYPGLDDRSFYPRTRTWTIGFNLGF
jgi:TonB-linked SusC/RagA family outer membrane protein